MSGDVQIGEDLTVKVFDKNRRLIDEISPIELTGGRWGAVYERCVGLHFESKGYEVEYRGATLGFGDRGVDLVARKNGEQRFIQCKFASKRFSISKVEWILYKASSFLQQEANGENQFFELVVPSIDMAFPKERLKNGQRGSKVMERLLFYNFTQKKVKIVVTEIPLPVPDSFSIKDWIDN